MLTSLRSVDIIYEGLTVQYVYLLTNRKLMILSMVKTGDLVHNTRNRDTCFEAGFTVSDFSLRIIKSIAWFRRIRFRIHILIDHALNNTVSFVMTVFLRNIL